MSRAKRARRWGRLISGPVVDRPPRALPRAEKARGRRGISSVFFRGRTWCGGNVKENKTKKADPFVEFFFPCGYRKMEVWVLPNGVRDRRGRPYISEEELNTNFRGIYDPLNLRTSQGLYDAAPPTCSAFADEVAKFRREGGAPVARVTGGMFLQRGQNPPHEIARRAVLARSASARAAAARRHTAAAQRAGWR
jgi:hypothetical protein